MNTRWIQLTIIIQGPLIFFQWSHMSQTSWFCFSFIFFFFFGTLDPSQPVPPPPLTVTVSTASSTVGCCSELPTMGIIHRSFTGTRSVALWLCGTERAHCTHCTWGSPLAQPPISNEGVAPDWGVAYSAILWHKFAGDKMRNWQHDLG